MAQATCFKHRNRGGEMDTASIKCLINSISRLVLLVSCQTVKSVPIQKVCRTIADVLKLLKPLLDEVVDYNIPSDDILFQECEELDMAVNEAREFMENWSPKSSKLLSALRSEPLLIKIQNSSLKICCTLSRLLQSSSSASGLMGLQQCMQEIERLKPERVTEYLEEALKSQTKDFMPSIKYLMKITELLSLTSSQELLKESIAVEKERITVEVRDVRGELDQINQIVILVSHIREFMVKSDRITASGIPVPSYFRCPLSSELILDPVIVASGQTYERTAIQKWLDHGLIICPITRQRLTHTNLIPNYSFKVMVESWCQENNIKLVTNSDCTNAITVPSPLGHISPEGLIHTDTQYSIHSSNSTSRSSAEVEKQRKDVSPRLSGEKSNGRPSGEKDQSSPKQSYIHSRSESASSTVSSVDYMPPASIKVSGISNKHEKDNEFSGEITSEHPVAYIPNKESGISPGLSGKKSHLSKANVELASWHDSPNYPNKQLLPFSSSESDGSTTASHVMKLVEDLKSQLDEVQTRAAEELRLLAKHNMDASAVAVQQSKQPPVPTSPVAGDVKNTPSHSFTASPFPSPLPAGVAPSPARTPGRKFRWPLPPPSPAKPIMAAFRRRREAKPKDGPIPEENNHQGGEEEGERGLDKSFGYGKNFGAKFELGKEVGRGHFGHTCSAKGKKGELKGQPVAVKIISKAKMTTAIAIEDVRREVKILKALSGHKNLVKFYDAFEDANNVYIVMELCEGGELLDKILSRGGRYTEEDAKVIVVQILSVVAYCHLQGVVHRDLKPENFLFATREEDASMRVIDFGLSDFIRPDQRLNDIVGSAYYVAPEVLHRSYSVEADMWSIGVITYILLCGSRPFWARTESGIFRSVLRADPNFNDTPWPTVSPEAKDFVKRLLNKDHRKRMTAAQALTHPWLRDERRAVSLDLVIYKLVRSYVRATPFRRAAMKALSKAITEDELYYLRAQFTLLEPKHGYVSLDNFRTALMKNSTDAMKESRVHDIINVMEPLAHKKLDFEEFCVAAISTYQLEALEGWEKIASTAFECFEREGNRVISVEELAQEMNLGPTSYSLLRDWIRTSDRKLSFLGYTKFLHGVTIRTSNTRHR